jgi:hypothetical protein
MGRAGINHKRRGIWTTWGCRRYQRKIFGKGDGDEITIGRQARLHLKKQNVMLHVTSHAERDITVLDSKTGSVTLGYRPS